MRQSDLYGVVWFNFGILYLGIFLNCDGRHFQRNTTRSLCRVKGISLQSERDFSSCSMGHSVGHKTDLITLTLSQCCDYDVVKMSSVKKKFVSVQNNIILKIRP